MLDLEDIQRIFYQNLKNTYQLDFSLKDIQKNVILECMKGNDVLALLPTGFGKSLCYWLTPLLHDETDKLTQHISVVVSPLTSLMLDQVSFLNSKGVRAVCINKDTTKDEFDLITRGRFSVVFCSPEVALSRRNRELFLTDVYQKNLCLVACDEAHCISEWGEDFRPDFRELNVLKSLIRCPVLALTATVTNKVKNDIMTYLDMDRNDTRVFAILPDRSNIFLDAKCSTENVSEELSWIICYLKKGKQTAKKIIVYCRSVTDTFKIFSFLAEGLAENLFEGGGRTVEKRRVEMYHANSDDATKERILQDFPKENSTIRCLVATIAFGMGIQIPDVRIVVHWGASRSVLQYWQEVGRCARSGVVGLAKSYFFPRSSIKNRCSDEMREVITEVTSQCIRVSLLKHMCIDEVKEELEKIVEKNECQGKCQEACVCSFCSCCTFCRDKCSCPQKVDRLNTFCDEV